MPHYYLLYSGSFVTNMVHMCKHAIANITDEYFTCFRYNLQITVSARSKAWTLLAHWNAGIVCSNPTQSMNVCVCFSVFLLFCVGSVLATAWSLVRRVILTVKKYYYETEAEARAQQKTEEPQMNEWMSEQIRYHFVNVSCGLLLHFVALNVRSSWAGRDGPSEISDL
jgi:hypothetical protein